MKTIPASKFRQIVFLSITLSLWGDTNTLAGSEPKELGQVKLNEAQSNSQFPKFLVLDKENRKQSLIKIENPTGRKDIIQKQTGIPYFNILEAPG